MDRISRDFRLCDCKYTCAHVENPKWDSAFRADPRLASLPSTDDDISRPSRPQKFLILKRRDACYLNTSPSIRMYLKKSNFSYIIKYLGRSIIMMYFIEIFCMDLETRWTFENPEEN